MSIADNIRRLREDHGLTQQELGDIAGVTDKAVSSWEAGLREPRMGAIQRMADYFHVTKCSIIEDDPDSFRHVSEDEAKLLNLYHKLNKEGQEKLTDYADDLVRSEKYIKTRPLALDA